MVAYSFRKRFALPIVEGVKRQTIRADRRRHARVGEEIQLYYGMRTRQCQLLGRSICTGIAPVKLSFCRSAGPLAFIVDGAMLTADEMDQFAIDDGFDSDFPSLEMAEFFLRNLDFKEEELVFSGVLIKWGDLLSDEDIHEEAA